MPNVQTKASRVGALTAMHVPGRAGGRGDPPFAVVLRVVAVAGLAIDVWAHATLESTYALNGGAISQGRLFGAEAVVAGAVALWLLLSGSRLAWLATFAVATGGLAAVLLYFYVNVGSIGPIPNMYEPVWYFRKSISAYAEGAAAFASFVRSAMFALPRLSGRAV